MKLRKTLGYCRADVLENWAGASFLILCGGEWRVKWMKTV